MRAKTGLVGLPQSVGRIGSQTTNTFRSANRAFFSSSSIAEAPRRHVAQVGDSNRTKRGLADAPSNAA